MAGPCGPGPGAGERRAPGVYHPLVGPRDDDQCRRLAAEPHSPGTWRDAFRAAGDGSHYPDKCSLRQLRALIYQQTVNWATRGATADRSGVWRLDLRPADSDVLVDAQAAGPAAAVEVAVLNMDILSAAHLATT